MNMIPTAASGAPRAAPLAPPLARALDFLVADESAAATWVVGGGLRDRLSGRPVSDLDLVTAADALGTATRLAARMRGSLVVLDRARDIARVVWSGAAGPVTLDLARLARPDLTGDLTARDFTVNALALPLAADVAELLQRGGAPLAARLTDPTGGLADLADGRLRMVAEANLDDDPLRLIRGVRLAAELGLSVDGATRRAITARASSLSLPAPERLRQELLRALVSPRAGMALDLADAVGLLDVLFGELAAGRGVQQSLPHDRDVRRHSLDAAIGAAWLLGRIEGERTAPVPARLNLPPVFVAAVDAAAPDLAPFFAQAPTMDELPRRAWLLLGALLHDIGKVRTAQADPLSGRLRFPGHAEAGAQMTRVIARRLRACAPGVAYLEGMVRCHMLPLWLSSGPPLDGRIVHRYFRAAGELGVDAALFSLADNAAKAPLETPGAERMAATFSSLMRAWFHERERLVESRPAVDGRSLQAALGLAPGPQLGSLLSGLREAVAAGEVAADDAESALAWARRRLPPAGA